MGRQKLPLPEQDSFQVLNLAGGLNTRGGYFNVSDGAQSPLETIDSKGVDFNWLQAASTRMPFALKGYIKSSSGITIDSNTGMATAFATASTPGYIAICQLIENTSGSAQTFNYVNVKFSPLVASGFQVGYPQKFRVTIRNVSNGVPTTIISQSGYYYSTQWSTNPAVISAQLKNFVLLNNNTGCFICIEFQNMGVNGIYQTPTFYGTIASVHGVDALVTQDFVNFSNFGIGALQFLVQAYLGSSQNVFDMRTSSQGSIVQNVMGVNSGALYAGVNGFSPTSLLTGYNQDFPWSLLLASNNLIGCDYGTHYPFLWDGSSTAPMNLGFRIAASYNLLESGAGGNTGTISSWSGAVATLSANQSANGLYVGRTVWLIGGTGYPGAPQLAEIMAFTTTGTVGTSNYYVITITFAELPTYSGPTSVIWNGCSLAVTNSGGNLTSTTTNTLYKILPVTQMSSGGFRAGEELTVTLPASATAAVINLTDIDMNSSTSGTGFGTDIPTQATTWYMAGPFNPQALTTDTTNSAIGGEYYQLPTTAISTSENPMANSTTSFNITAAPATTQPTLLQNTSLPQAFFQSQVDAPCFKYAVVWNDMLVTAGDPNNPSSLWLSFLGGVQIWSLNGGVNGTLLPIPNFTDGQIIRGLYVYQNSLFVFKNQSIYRILFVGNTVNGASPFVIQKIMGNYGCLSHWGITETDQGIVFLSDNGPMICYGSICQPLPIAAKILDRFQSQYSEAYNLSQMIVHSGCQYKNKKQIWWNFASNATTSAGFYFEFDGILIYDYEKQAFSEYKDVYTGFIGLVGDSNDFQIPWYAGVNQDFGEFEQFGNGATAHEYNGSQNLGIPFEFSTGWLNFGDPTAKKNLRNLFSYAELMPGLSTAPTQAQLGVDVFLDYASAPVETLFFDLTNAQTILGGLETVISSMQQAHVFKLRFWCGDYGALLRFHGFRLDWQELGSQV